MIAVDKLKRELGIEADDTSRDVDIAELEAAAVAFFERITGRYFGTSAAAVEYFDNAGTSDVLFLADAALGSPAPVVEEMQGDAWTTVATTDYEIIGSRVYRLHGDMWPYGRRNIRVTYNRGYAANAVPADVREAVMAIAVDMWKKNQAGGMRSESIGGYSYTMGEGIGSGVREIIELYRRPVLA